mgnify:CR=1 FL=1
MKETRSTCCYCGVGCGVIIESDGAQITGVRGDPDHPANFGRLCSKGASLHLTPHAPTRALFPELRESRTLPRRRVSWDAALDHAAARFAGIVKEHDGWIEVGEQHMTGDTAQWYARSRYTTNDWDRMKRQRELQEAILTQFTPANVMARFQDVALAGTDLVKTDLPQSMLGYFVELAVKSRALPVHTIELTPEGGVDPDHPDFEYIRQLVQSALHPPVPTDTPAP